VHLTRAEITGVVLCGGRGSRMGGVDKGLVDYRGRALVDHAIARLGPQVGSLMLNANRHLDAYRERGLCVVDDGNAAFDGPLAGLAASLDACTTPWLACVPCDAPMFPLDLVEQLGSSLGQAASAELAVASHAGRLQPVFALMQTRLAGSIRDSLARGDRRLASWLDRQAVVIVDFDDGDFRNLNTPDDLDADG
jgi:molybdopterin-guanine dinucleotide biosynthesis protein A